MRGRFASGAHRIVPPDPVSLIPVYWKDPFAEVGAPAMRTKGGGPRRREPIWRSCGVKIPVPRDIREPGVTSLPLHEVFLQRSACGGIFTFPAGGDLAEVSSS